MVPEHRYVTIDETASLLAVSSATIRNWVRRDYLRPEGRNSGVRFRYDDVRDLRERIRSGALPRLLGRANKAGAKKTFIPDEYLRDRSCIGKLEEAVTRIGRAGVDCERAVFILSLSLAFRCMGWDRRDMRSFLGDEFRPPERNRLGRELECWHAALGRFTFTKEQLSLLDLYLPEQRDALGLIYQSLLREGRKARGGAYYT
ncbi:MAG: DNA-binding protein, partial [Chrysiogenales bacterium]